MPAACEYCARMKRRIPIFIGLAAIAIALVVWRWRGDESTTSSTSAATTAKAVAAGASKRVDPRTLQRGLISGNVRDENKRPIAGATMCADIEDADVPSSLRESVCTISDAHGAYALRELLASTYEVVAGAKTHRPSSTILVLGGGGSRLGVDLVLASWWRGDRQERSSRRHTNPRDHQDRFDRRGRNLHGRISAADHDAGRAGCYWFLAFRNVRPYRRQICHA